MVIPAPTTTWKSINVSVTIASVVTPSKVADLVTRLRNRTGPRSAGASGSGPVAAGTGEAAIQGSAAELWGDPDRVERAYLGAVTH